MSSDRPALPVLPTRRRIRSQLTTILNPIYRLSNMKPETSDLLPLSPATLHVLLALTGGDLHGYGIMLEVARQSGGAYKIGPGTLYDNIKKLLKLGLVEESAADTSEAEPRRTYHLTHSGSSVLAAETERLSGVLRQARRGLRLHEERQS
jgi:DNA-binding PadR family transcriptional regulator